LFPYYTARRRVARGDPLIEAFSSRFTSYSVAITVKPFSLSRISAVLQIIVRHLTRTIDPILYGDLMRCGKDEV
jgi:isopentenyl phosphate kinase